MELPLCDDGCLYYYKNLKGKKTGDGRSYTLYNIDATSNMVGVVEVLNTMMERHVINCIFFSHSCTGKSYPKKKKNCIYYKLKSF